MGAVIGLIIAVLMAAASAARGADISVPPISAADFTTAAEASPVWLWIAGEGLWAGVAVAVAALVYKLLRPYIAEWVNQSRLADLYNAVEAGVIGTYETYTKEIKRANADGKLTEEEAATAKQMAREYAVAYMRAQGVDLLKVYGQQVLDGLIEYFVGKSSMAKAVAGPLSELEP